MTRLILALVLVLAPFQESAPTVIAKGAIQPQLAADKDGGFYCAFIRNGNIELSLSTDNGRTWSAPVVAIDAKGKAKGGMQRGPRIGVDDKKAITITAPLCFDEKELAKKYPTAELWLARSTDGGKTFSKPVQVNEQNGTAPEALHAMAVEPDGSTHVAWLDMRGREDGQDLYYAKVVDGKPGKNVKVASTVCTCCAPGIATDVKGNPHIVWRDGATSDNRIILRSLSLDGGMSFAGPGQVNERETGVAGCPMDAPAVAVTNDGKLTAVAWMDLRAGGNNRRVYWRLLFRADHIDTPLVEISTGVQGHPSMGMDAKGLHIAWEDFRGEVQRIHYRRWDGKEVAISPATAKATFPSLACGKIVGVAFELGNDVVFATPPQ